MKLFFFHTVQKDMSLYSKISDQIKTFKYYVDIGEMEMFDTVVSEGKNSRGNNVFSINGHRVTVLNFKNKIFAFYNWKVAIPRLYKLAYQYIRNNHYTHIYIRRVAFYDCNQLKFLKRLKNAGIKIIYEIPTYPYDLELIKGSMTDKLDKKNRKKFHLYIDRIATPAKVNYIFNIKTISFMNGIIVGDVTKRKVVKDRDRINLIAVAGLQKWHGYDRFVKGLGEYYKNGGKRDLVFHLVSGGEKSQAYWEIKELIKIYSLENHVKLYGFLKDKKLDDIYNKCSIGIASLGMHRINLDTASTLKTREYTAKGLPVVSSCKIDFFSDDYSYVFNVPADDSAIKIEDIIGFHDKLYVDEKDYEVVAEKIRQYAKKHCDMKITMKPIINYINQPTK